MRTNNSVGKNEKQITTLFLDIGGVLLTNGWDRGSRKKAAAYFGLDAEVFDERHHLTFNLYEEGKLTLSEYLERVVFHRERSFTVEDFMTFMYDQSHEYPDVIEFFLELKKQYQLKIVAVSNEGRELNSYRIKKFKLNELFDVIVSSAFVHLRKPDAGIFQMALDMSLTKPEQAIYIDDRLMFVEVAETFGMHGLHYRELNEAKIRMETFGFSLATKTT